MLDELINTRTQSLLESYARQPSSSLILDGDADSGAHEICSTVIKQILGASHANNIVIIEPEGGKSIGVEQVRQLKRTLMTAAGRIDEIARVAILRNAEKLTTEAQNSLLKLIEEPSRATLLILLVDNAGSLLKTVRSRCQIIKILPITKQQALTYSKTLGLDKVQAEKAFLLSSGKAKLFLEILNGTHSHTSEAIEKAKAFVSATPFERLKRQKELSDSSVLSQLMNGLAIVAEAGLHGTNKTNRNRWENILRTTKHCQSLQERNTPTKLVYLHLCVSV